MELRIKETAEAAGVSVRTLHHYDKIGLLKPEFTSSNGYRFYSESNLKRLQDIMFLKELDFSLNEIKRILDSPGFNRAAALRTQRLLLIKKRERLDSIIRTIDNTILSDKEGIKMKNSEIFSAFDYSEIEEHKRKYAHETEMRYGGTDAYMESSKRTASYSRADWERITAEGKGILKELSRLMELSTDAAEVQAAVENWRRHISESYYNCTIDILEGLGQTYTADKRFRDNIDRIEPGLAEFLSEAIVEYCSRARLV